VDYGLNKLKLLYNSLKSRIGAIKNGFDVRDFFVLGGLALLGYGLFLFRPWVSFSVCGCILMLIGYFMKDRA